MVTSTAGMLSKVPAVTLGSRVIKGAATTVGQAAASLTMLAAIVRQVIATVWLDQRRTRQ